MNAYELADELQFSATQAEDHGTIAKRSKKTADLLRQQADQIEHYKHKADYLDKRELELLDKIRKYEQALQSIANDYHELSDHKIEVQVRKHKKWAREALE